jgi:hypothetical protein
MIEKDKLKRMWEEVVVACVKALSLTFPGNTDECS